jgi:hypothetical protein
VSIPGAPRDRVSVSHTLADALHPSQEISVRVRAAVAVLHVVGLQHAGLVDVPDLAPQTAPVTNAVQAGEDAEEDAEAVVPMTPLAGIIGAPRPIRTRRGA